MLILELLDAPYDYKMRSRDNIVVGTFTNDTGSEIEISAEKYIGGVWILEFTRDLDVAKTGGGDAARIFATVAKFTLEFLKDSKPLFVTFIANHSSPGRVRLYKRMLTRLTNDKYVSLKYPDDRLKIKNLKYQDSLWSLYSKVRDRNEFFVIALKSEIA